MGVKLMEPTLQYQRNFHRFTINDWVLEAVMDLVAGSEVCVGVDEGKIVHWELIKGEAKQPTEVEIANKVSKLKEDYTSKQYSRDRRSEYDLLNQFEMQFDDQRDGTSTWVDAINTIKAKYPKE